MFDRYTNLFCVGFVIAIIAFMIFSMLLNVTIQIHVPTGASIATVIGGTVFVSSKYAHEVGHIPANNVSWKYAFRWSFLAIVISFALLSGLIIMMPDVLTLVLNNIVPVLVFLTVVYMFCVVLIRVTFPYFVQTQLKK